MKNILSLSLAVLAALFLAGCKSTEKAQFKSMEGSVPSAGLTVLPKSTNAPSTQALLQPPTDLFTLGPGDRIEIEIIGSPLSRNTAVVGPDGRVYYHLLAGLDVWGLTLSQTKSALEKELAKYISEPQVGVTLRGISSKSVWLMGRFAHPGIYPMSGPMTLLEAFSVAGGTAKSASAIKTEELGDLTHSFVMRDGQMLPVDVLKLLQEGDMSQNIYLRSDDMVYVPSASSREIYVLGAVRAPRAIPYRDKLTVVSAIAGAYGTIKDAYLTHVAVVRGSLTNPEMIVVDYRAIITGQTTDFVLEPHDIVFVPFSPYRTLTKYLELVLKTFGDTVAANEGAFLANPNAAAVTPSVPVGAP